MNSPQFFGLVPPPYFDTTGYEGKLIVIRHPPTTIDDQHFKGFLEYRLLGRLLIP